MIKPPPDKPRCPTCGGDADQPGTLGCEACRRDAAIADRPNLAYILWHAWAILVFVVLLPAFAAWLLWWRIREAVTCDWPHAGCDDSEAW